MCVLSIHPVCSLRDELHMLVAVDRQTEENSMVLGRMHALETHTARFLSLSAFFLIGAAAGGASSSGSPYSLRVQHPTARNSARSLCTALLEERSQSSELFAPVALLSRSLFTGLPVCLPQRGWAAAPQPFAFPPSPTTAGWDATLHYINSEL
jgi:hypothetical protein